MRQIEIQSKDVFCGYAFCKQVADTANPARQSWNNRMSFFIFLLRVRPTKDGRGWPGFYLKSKMLALHKQMNMTDQQRRIAYRCEVEKFCEAVKSLPAQKQMVFLLYFRHGYSMKDLSILCKVHEGTICRRLKRTAKEIEKTLSNIDSGRLPVSTETKPVD